MITQRDGTPVRYGSRVKTDAGREGTFYHYDQNTGRCIIKWDDEVHPDPVGFYPSAINCCLRSQP